MSAALKPYGAMVNGVETTLMLTEDDAKQRGLVEKKAEPAANKSRTAANKSKG